jgi:hypothetical protein
VADRRTGTSFRSALEDSQPERLSQNGHLLGIAIYGALVLVGFMFGIVTGYERPRSTSVARLTKDSAQPTNPSTGSNPNGSSTGASKFTPPTTSEPETPSLGTKTEPKTEPISKIEPKPKDNPPPKSEILPPKKETVPPKKDPQPMVTTRPVSFQKDVLPIFRSYCLNCHGESGKPKGEVDLRTVAAIKRGGGGPILEIGKPEQSAIYTTIVDGSMPPDGKKKPTKGELDVIRNWILTGANPRRSIRNRRGHGAPPSIKRS